MEQSAEERAAAVEHAEDGAADLKNKFEELSKSLDEHEKEYQVIDLKILALHVNRNFDFEVKFVLLTPKHHFRAY